MIVYEEILGEIWKQCSDIKNRDFRYKIKGLIDTEIKRQTRESLLKKEK